MRDKTTNAVLIIWRPRSKIVRTRVELPCAATKRLKMENVQSQDVNREELRFPDSQSLTHPQKLG